MMRVRSCVLVAVSFGLSPMAQATPTKKEVVPVEEAPTIAVDWRTIVGWGPVTGVTSLGARYRHIYRRDHNPLWNGLYLQTGATVGTSTFTHSGSVHVEVQPLAVLRVRLQAETWRWLGKPSEIGTGLPFPTADSPSDPETLARRSDETIRTHGRRGLLMTTLQGRVGSFAMQNMTRVSAWLLPEGDGYLYDSESDNLIARGQWDQNIRNRLCLLWMAPSRLRLHRLMVGPIHEFVQSREAARSRHRVGAMLVYMPVQRWGALWEPTLMLDVGITAKDRYRQGETYVFGMLKLSLSP